MNMARALKAQDPKLAKPSKPKILIFGRPGVGKTWASIDFPSVYYMDTEGGANLAHYTAKLSKAGGRYFGPEQGSLDFDSVIEEIITLATVKHDYRTLVIDSYSKLFNTCVDATAERMKSASKKVEFGIEKKEAISYSRRMVRWFDKLDMNVILICHEKDRWSNGECIGQTFDGWDKLEYELHLCLRIQKQGVARKAFVVKSRLEAFPDGDVWDWSYLAFAGRYGQDVIEGAAIPIDPATSEQVRTLESLIGVLKLDDKTTDKWKEKAGVERFAEMDSETIQKCISFLTNKLPKGAAA
jgi:hypothetical protein